MYRVLQKKLFLSWNNVAFLPGRLQLVVQANSSRKSTTLSIHHMTRGAEAVDFEKKGFFWNTLYI